MLKSNIKEEGPVAVKTRLEKNGFYNIRSMHKQPCKNKNKNDEIATILQLNFVSDRCNRRINKILKKYNFKIKLASKPAKFLKHCLGRSTQIKKHDNCEVCRILPESFKCDEKFLVYKFTCKKCKQFYIGETCRPFKIRYLEHSRSLKSKNKISALAEHAPQHSGELTIADFDVSVIRRCSNPLETRLSESTAINRFRPSLNRKHEMI